MKAINLTSGQEVADRLTVADTLFPRMKGLLGKKSPSLGEGLWIKPCIGVHTFGMKFPIDVVFLDRKNMVIATRRNVMPNRITRHFMSASSVLELPSGLSAATAINIGDEIRIIL